MSDPTLIPDIAGTIIGWRCWGIARTPDGILLASQQGTVWPARTALAASCPTGKHHTPPGDKCSCGIYALAEGEGFPYYQYNGPSYAVFGQVSLWGAVVRGTKGYRAQYGYPKALHLAYKDWSFARPLEDAYGIPVRLRNPYNTESS